MIVVTLKLLYLQESGIQSKGITRFQIQDGYGETVSFDQDIVGVHFVGVCNNGWLIRYDRAAIYVQIRVLQVTTIS